MRDRIRASAAPAAPGMDEAQRPVLSDDTITLLGQLADKLDAYWPGKTMREETRLAQALVFAEKLHGATEAAFAAEQDLLAAAPRVRPGQSRGEYAALLRLIAQGVTP